MIPIGRPRAKSFDCVEKIPYNPALPIFLVIIRERTTTSTKTINFAVNILPRNGQETWFRSKMAKFLNSSAGRANLPTRVVILRASLGSMSLKRPKRYPSNITAKD